jgi:hypothetical protein
MSDQDLDAQLGKAVREYRDAGKRLEELTAEFQPFVKLGPCILSDSEQALRILVNLRQDLTMGELCAKVAEYRDTKARQLGLKSLLPKGLLD